MAAEQQVDEDEGIRGLHEVISGLWYRNANDIEYLLNYSSENDTVMESPTNEQIIQGVMGTFADDDHDVYNSYNLLNVFIKRGFLI